MQTKTARIHIRCTPKEKKKMEEIARRAGMSISRLVIGMLSAHKNQQ